MAPTTSSTLLPYIIELNPLNQEQKKRVGLLLSQRILICRVTSSQEQSRVGSPEEHLPVSICLVLMFGFFLISFQYSDPQRIHGPVQDRDHRLHRQLLQNQHPAPAQQGGIHLERRIFCGRPNQSYCPALHVRKESVLQRQTHIGGERKKRRECVRMKSITISEVTRYQG